MAGKENLPKPPQLAHAFAYSLLTLYHHSQRLSIVSREKYSSPFLRLSSCALPLEVPADLPTITRGLRPYKSSVLHRKRSKRVLLYNYGYISFIPYFRAKSPEKLQNQGLVPSYHF